MKKVKIPSELKGQELFKFLKENKDLLKAQKKYEIKKADAFTLSNYYVTIKGEVKKGNNPIMEDIHLLNTSLVINTTNWFDSHGDVHIPNLWKKSLAENKGLYLLQEHQMTFEGIITDQVTAFVKTIPWRNLGYDSKGDTQALIFNAAIDDQRNPYMFGQYKKGNVKNHSVGMRYVMLDLAINDDSKYYVDEFELWNKYIDQIANKSEVEDNGYFWAVTEAKLVEGSAVPIGSNIMTPTLSNGDSSKSTFIEPSNDTQNEPHKKTKMAVCNNCGNMQPAEEEGTTKCNKCGQYMSPNSNSMQMDENMLGGAVEQLSAEQVLSMIKETKFIKI